LKTSDRKVGVTDAGVTDVGSVLFAERLGPKALGDTEFEGLGAVLHNLVNESMLIEGRRFQAGDPGGEVALG